MHYMDIFSRERVRGMIVYAYGFCSETPTAACLNARCRMINCDQTNRETVTAAAEMRVLSKCERWEDAIDGSSSGMVAQCSGSTVDAAYWVKFYRHR